MNIEKTQKDPYKLLEIAKAFGLENHSAHSSIMQLKGLLGNRAPSFYTLYQWTTSTHRKPRARTFRKFMASIEEHTKNDERIATKINNIRNDTEAIVSLIGTANSSQIEHQHDRTEIEIEIETDPKPTERISMYVNTGDDEERKAVEKQVIRALTAVLNKKKPDTVRIEVTIKTHST